MERRSLRHPWQRQLIWLVCACALVTLAGAWSAVMAFRAPLETVRTEIGTAISQRGKYSWTASLYPNHLYGGRRVSDESTVFTNITRALNMEFSYQMNAVGATELSGTYAVDLTIRAGQNWSKRVALVSPRRFTAKGDTATFWAQYTLDIQWLNSLVDEIERETGIVASEYSLLIQPSVATAVAGAQATNQTFAAPIDLVWSDKRRQITMPLQREFVTETSLPVVTRIPGTMAVFDRTLPVSPARIWSVVVTGCALLLTLWLATLARLARGETGAAEQRLKRANPRIFIEGRAELPPALPTIEVRDLTQLVKVARETGRPVIHAPAGNVHYVVDSGVVYLCGEALKTSSGPYPALVPRRQRRNSTMEA